MVGRMLLVLSAWLLLALPAPSQDVPPPLRDWQDWVLHDVPRHACPFLAGQMPGAEEDSYRCAWPARLDLAAGAGSADFSLAVHVDAPSWVALPGGARYWPQQVSANGQAQVVLPHDGQPMLWLQPGDYTLHGVLPWSSRPARLRVPAAIGLVALKVDGSQVSRIERDGGQLTLGEAAATQRGANALAVRVYRALHDGLPPMLDTRLQLDVAGSAREQLLGPALPAGFVATRLSGDLPARLDADGRLRVQLRPGQWTLTLQARGSAPLSRIAMQLPGAPWPRQETWSYVDDSSVRTTRVEGRAVDAAQAGVPDDWRPFPAYRVADGAGLRVEQVTRGEQGTQASQLHLQRELWLDFDGRGLSAADHLVGTLRHRQRLDVTAPWQLQRAAQEGTPLLLSQDKHGGGVELRDEQLDLSAGLRLATAAGALPASGWQAPLEGIDATLHLPPGYRLLGAPGADRSPDSWVAHWSLLDLFVAALASLLAGRLLGWRWAVLVAALLALSLHEGGAPRWSLALLLAIALLWRALPQGRLRLSAGIAAALMLALVTLCALPFAATELQQALHPQLESLAYPGTMPGRVHTRVAVQPGAPVLDEQAARQPPPKIIRQVAPPPAPPAPPAPPSAAQASPPVQESASSLASVMVTGSALASSGTDVSQVDGRVVQAGPGTPQWDVGNDYRLGWSGPVSPAQTVRLVIAPAWLVRLLRVLMVALLAAVLARLAATLRPLLRRPWTGGSVHAVVRGGVALLALALLAPGLRAQSLPSPELLAQLRSRLTEAPRCAPDCASVAQAQLQADAGGLQVSLQVATGATVALPLPQPDEALQLLEASVDGHAGAPLLRSDGAVLLRLDRGVHRVDLSYRIHAGADGANLRFALPPRRVLFAGQGWSLDGVDDGRLLGDSLALRRVRSAAAGQAPAPTQGFPPYVRLTRIVHLGVDWSVENVVQRVAPHGAGFSVNLPLLPGEHPLGDDAPVADGHIRVSFKAGDDVVRWNSRLDHAAQLTLVAPALAERAETWRVDAAPMWHVDASGVPASGGNGTPDYRPLPGEQLHLVMSRPAALPGGSLALDRVQVRTRVGERSAETTLQLATRSTRGGEHAIGLPAGAQLLDARRDGEPVELAVHDGTLGLPLLPGAHDYSVRLRQPQGVAALTRTPGFDLKVAAANIDLTLQLPRDRWVLWSWGPGMGPAVLYWSQLAVLLLVAWLLARYAPTPLRLRHWLLLGLGFSAFAWSAYALVVAWLILLGVRARPGLAERLPVTAFNLLQAALALLSLLALAVLVGAVPKGLLGLPDMHVAGNGSSAWMLQWFADRSQAALPRGGVLSVSLWFYKLAMLAWALWLANALVGWLRWGFGAWTRGGYWRRSETAPPPLPPAQPPSE